MCGRPVLNRTIPDRQFCRIKSQLDKCKDTQPRRDETQLDTVLAHNNRKAIIKRPEATFSAKVLPSILAPDAAHTRIGTLKFFDGLPD